MERNKIEEYIEKGLELDLLDKLNSFVIDGFDSKCENLIKILMVLQERAKIDWMQPNRALVNVIIKVLPNIMESEDDLKRFVALIKKSALSPYKSISYLNRQFIIGIEDKDSQITDSGVSTEELKSFQNELKRLNEYFLAKEIQENHAYSSIIGLLYNCVEQLGDERKVFLTENALKLFRAYISSTPKQYFLHFLRPYYSGTRNGFIEHYYHVPEPFYKQIFMNEDFSFNNFVKIAKEKDFDEDLTNDVIEFVQRYQQIDASIEDKKVILFSSEMHSLGFKNLDRFLKLQSSNHAGVRKECMPPDYKA